MECVRNSSGCSIDSIGIDIDRRTERQTDGQTDRHHLTSSSTSQWGIINNNIIIIIATIQYNTILEKICAQVSFWSIPGGECSKRATDKPTFFFLFAWYTLDALGFIIASRSGNHLWVMLWACCPGRNSLLKATQNSVKKSNLVLSLWKRKS